MGRALIIGVENYANSHGLDATLPGTTQAATQFRQWLIDRKRLAADQILFCAEAGTAGRTHGTNRADLLRAMLDVVQGGTAHLVAVQTGLFAQTLVQVSGPGLTAGLRVQVPSS